MSTSTSLPRNQGGEENDLNQAQEPRPRGRERPASAILLGGLVAGTLDIAVASFINHVSPRAVLTFIASGLLGRTAFSDGGAAVALGLALQWAMSLIIAAIYVRVGRALRFAPRHWVARGLLAGVVIFAVMNLVVLPLSAAPHLPAPSAAIFLQNVGAMLVFGLIIAYCARDIA
jgi:hypothetical protein